MTLEEMIKKVLGLIEELNPNHKDLTDDPDIATKMKDVINQVMYELARLKKIPRYVEFDVTEGETIDFARIENECGSEVYQICKVSGVNYEFKAQNTIIKVLESGTIEIELNIYPERITSTTNAKIYEFELSPDVLEIMPYGVAGDLLKSDISAEYGKIYSKRFEDMIQRVDSRYNVPSISYEGGVNF